MSRRWRAGGALLGIAWLASGIFVVGAEEQGVVNRCGRYRPLLVEPGAHWGWPWPIDRVGYVKPREMKSVTLRRPATLFESHGEPGEYSTGDRNLVRVQATVQYTIGEARRYLSQAERVEPLLSALAESALASELAASEVDAALMLNQRGIGERVRRRIAAGLADYELGIELRGLELSRVEPPEEVAEAFERVSAALREREQAAYEAEGESQRIVAGARIQSRQRLDLARSAARQRVQLARGEAERFTRLEAQYRQSPELTAARMYREALTAILPRLRSKLVVGSEAPLDVGILPPSRP